MPNKEPPRNRWIDPEEEEIKRQEEKRKEEAKRIKQQNAA